MTFHPDTPLDYRNAIVTGDARELAARLPDASVDLIFTDPVYSERDLYDWLGHAARRLLKAGGAVLCWSNGKWHYPNTRWLEAAGLTWRWTFDSINMDKNAPLSGKIICKKSHVIWLDVSGTSRLRTHMPDAFLAYSDETLIPRMEFKWHKNSIYTAKLTEAFAENDAVVIDPFAGSATNPAVCKMLGRNYIAFEIDAATADRARARVDATQAMHPAFLVEQQEFAL